MVSASPKKKKKGKKIPEQPLALTVCLVCPAGVGKLFPIRQREIRGMWGWKVALPLCTDGGWPSKGAWELFHARQNAVYGRLCAYIEKKIKTNRERGTLGCQSATLQKERLTLFLIHNMGFSSMPDLAEGGTIGSTYTIKGTINFLYCSASSKLLHPDLLPIYHFLGSPKLQLCSSLSNCPLGISYRPEKWTFKTDRLNLHCNAFVQEETGLVFLLLLFLFRCQGCFSGGQIQSCLGQPSSRFSTVV